MTSHEHPPAASILALVAGASEADAAAVSRHLESCASCGSVAGDWLRLREALWSWSGSLPAPRPLAVPPPAARPTATARARHAMTVVAAQVPVVRRQVWAATALVAGVGCLVVALAGVVAGTVLALTAPVTAALGLAIIYGPDSDPCAEISLSCPVPPRTVLLARLVVVAGYDLAVGFAATLLLAGTGSGGGVWSLVTMWLGPLLAMSALSVLLSVFFPPVGRHRRRAVPVDAAGGHHFACAPGGDCRRHRMALVHDADDGRGGDGSGGRRDFQCREKGDAA